MIRCSDDSANLFPRKIIYKANRSPLSQVTEVGKKTPDDNSKNNDGSQNLNDISTIRFQLYSHTPSKNELNSKYHLENTVENKKKLLKKRKKEAFDINDAKVFKLNTGIIALQKITFEDESEEGEFENFDVYEESEIFGKEVEINQDQDENDCKTTTPQRDFCVEFLTKELQEILENI
ncbi:hypothetical protein SteCoe_24114 [Stentor coeruleus]|uniref:Uncharacterized protein n=1 Tax=Stentor coeruleus TaxID=5963 RepID=A0A1R2BI86_9CILI|nr:hypothetical protein SteCoe_24114 [Stentor coeruleus]